MAVGDSIKGRKISEPLELSPHCEELLQLLADLRGLADSVVPAEMQQAVRYGNPAYRDWFTQMEDTVQRHLAASLEAAGQGAAALELAPYIIDSFGNRTRIDYGTGHEMTFVMFVCGLFKVGFLGPVDMVAVGLKVFAAYFDLGKFGSSYGRIRLGMVVLGIVASRNGRVRNFRV
jgi:serine/threonine-protein phosphatase 2A activator